MAASIKVIGHRGVPAMAPENTLLGFRIAIEIGCNAIELDVRECADIDYLPVIHDATVERTTGGKGCVSKMDFSSLKQLDAGSGETIPDLREVLDSIKNDIQLFIEIKNPAIASNIAKIISKNVEDGWWSYENLVVISFYIDALKSVRKMNANIHIGITIAKDKDDIETKNIDKAFFFDADSNKTEKIANLIADLKPNYINFSKDIISSSLSAYAHSVGVKVNVWTVNNLPDVKMAIDCGVDGIMSDDPMTVMEAIKTYIVN